MSQGEQQIAEWLSQYFIDYIKEYSFDELPGHRFNFYLPNSKIVIEHDGAQHFEPKDMFGGEEALRIRQAKDAMKNEFCINHGIRILRVPYYVMNILTAEYFVFRLTRLKYCKVNSLRALKKVPKEIPDFSTIDL